MLSPVNLHDLALTLENERAFHDAYNNSVVSRQRSALQRRELIKSFIPYGTRETSEDREQLRRYFDDVYSLPKYEGNNKLAHLPTVEFWLDSVKYPDNPIYKAKRADDPKPITTGDVFETSFINECAGKAIDWCKSRIPWDKLDDAQLRGAMKSGVSLKEMCYSFGRGPQEVLNRAVDLGLVARGPTDPGTYKYQYFHVGDPKLPASGVPVSGQNFNIKYLREAPSGRLEWLNFGKKWKVIEEDELYQMFWAGCDLRTMCQELQRPPGGVLDRLVALRCLRAEHDLQTFETIYVVRDKPPQRKHPEGETYTSEPVPDLEEIQQEVADHLTQAADAFSNLANNLKEIIMNKTDIIVIETKTLINGVDISTFADSEIYDLIAKQEAEIETLDKIKTKPKKLVAEIEKRKAGIDALVAYLDSKPE